MYHEKHVSLVQPASVRILSLIWHDFKWLWLLAVLHGEVRKSGFINYELILRGERKMSPCYNA